jgi:hypothetical protein
MGRANQAPMASCALRTMPLSALRCALDMGTTARVSSGAIHDTFRPEMAVAH